MVAAIASAVALIALAVLTLLLLRERRERAAAEQRADGAQDRVSVLAATTQEAVALFTPAHTPELINLAFEQLTGYDAGSLVAQTPLLFVLPEDRPALLSDIADLNEAPGLLRTRHCRFLTRSGDVRWCTVAVSAGPDQGSYALAATDRTNERAAEERLRRDAELLGAVVEVQQAVGSAGLDADAVMHVIAERCRELTHADGASVLLREGDRLVVRVSAGVPMPELPVQGSLAGHAIRSNDVLVSHDLATDPRVDRTAWLPLGIRSLLAAPLLHDGQAVGALKVASTVPGAFGDDDARALRHLSGLLGAALAHASAFEARQQRLEERTRALQESEQRFKQLVDTAQEGIWVLDDRGVGTYVNPRLAELFGYPAGEMLGRPMMEFMDATGRQEALPTLERRAGGPVRADLRFRRRDGGELWTIAALSPIVDREGHPVGTVVMVSDITDRKRAEDRLRRSAERLRALHEMHSGVLGADSTAEVAQAALVRLQRLVPCQRLTVLLFDDDEGAARLVAGITNGLPMPEQRFPFTDLSPREALRRDEVRTVDDMAEFEPRPPIFDRLVNDGLRSLLSVPLKVDGVTIGELNLAHAVPAGFEPEHRDIAVEVATPLALAIQHARLRDELERRTAELERRIGSLTGSLRQSRSDAETLEAGLSRDLRDPLRHLQGFARLLLEQHGEELTAEARHYAERIAEAGRELATLVEGLTRLARVARQDLLARPVELDALVEEVLLEKRASLNGRPVEWEVGRLPLVTGDAALLRAAITELIDNAVRFTESRSPAHISIQPLVTDRDVGIAVGDNGIGFPPEHASRVFRVFERLQAGNGSHGHGIGLALVERVAQRHGGRAWAESVPGTGATFYLALPAPGAGALTER